MPTKREQPIALLIRRGDTVELLFPEDFAVAEQLRKKIPSRFRPKPSKAQFYRTWKLDPEAFSSAVDVLKSYGYRVESYSQGVSEKAKANEPSADRALLGVSDSAPWPVVEAAYRALAKMYHPDATRNTATMEQMKQINLAYERLRKGAGR